MYIKSVLKDEITELWRIGRMVHTIWYNGWSFLGLNTSCCIIHLDYCYGRKRNVWLISVPLFHGGGEKRDWKILKWNFTIIKISKMQIKNRMNAPKWPLALMPAPLANQSPANDSHLNLHITLTKLIVNYIFSKR